MPSISSTDVQAYANLAGSITSNVGAGIAAGGQVQADFGSAAADLIGEQGDYLQADAYTRAAGYAANNLSIAGSATAIQLAQQQRQQYQATGTTKADVAGAGFAESGSALAILRSNAQQGSLARQVINQQGLITENGYAAQEDSFKTQASVSVLAAQSANANALAAGKAAGTASSAQTTSFVSAGVAAIGVAALLFSDRRLKHEITFLRRLANGLGLYQFRYRGKDGVYEGVMAQEVEVLYPDAVHVVDGWLAVDYAALGLDMRQVA